MHASTTTRACLYYDIPFLTRPRFIAAACRKTDRMHVHVRDQTNNATYALTGCVPAVREDKDALPCVRRYRCSVPAVRGRNRFYFASNKEALPCVRRCSWWVQLSASPPKVLFRWLSFIDRVDHATPRAPRRWTTARPRKGMTRGQGRRGSGPHGGECVG